MLNFPVRPEKQQDLLDRMQALGVREEDLEEGFARASGRGGQKLHKTSSCVLLRHKPTGLRVRCEESRSQALNRFLARRRLVDILEARSGAESSRLLAERRKVIKQKERRGRRSRKKVESGAVKETG
jgi:peptide chain release factor